MVRCRSRRDFLEAISSPVFLEHALSNGARFENTIKLAAVPGIGFFAGPRVVIFVGLLLFGLAVQRLLRRRTEAADTKTHQRL